MLKERVLVTGCAGFIGMHLTRRLLKERCEVFGVDNFNDYYNPKLKYDRMKLLDNFENFRMKNLCITDSQGLRQIFDQFKPSKVVNLSAQAGVRYSLINPQSYIKSNVLGFMNILENCRNFRSVNGLIYASSSSVYGLNKEDDFSEKKPVESPISIYAATKRSNELMAHSYNHLFGLNCTGLRFFTVYGPWGRPDMAMYKFLKNILANKPISVFNHGIMERDFTYIDDIVSGVISSIKKNYALEIFNLGNNKKIKLMKVVQKLEQLSGKKAIINFLDIQKGDVKNTCANIDHAKSKLDYEPKVTFNEGVEKFFNWYKSYNKI